MNYNKYGNKKQIYKGMKFDSIRELNHWIYLCELQKQGIIWNLCRQTKLDVVINNKKVCYYKPDMEYDDSQGHHVIDVKSEITRKNSTYRLKKKLIEAYYEIEIEEIL